MSEDYHHSRRAIFTFPKGFDRSALPLNEEERRQPQQQQIQQDKLRLQRFEPDDPLVGICQADDAGCLLTYETAGMQSEVFNLGDRLGSNELLEQRLPSSYRNLRMAAAGFPSEWYVSGQSRQQIASINTDSVKAMQLFLTNPQPRSPSPPSSPRAVSTSTLNMLLRNPLGFHPIGSESTNLVGGDFSSSVIAPAKFARVPGTFHDSGAACRAIGGVVEGQGLSLSLSSSLAQLEAAKAEELRNMGYYQNSRHQVHLVNVLKNSKYAKPAQELLEECCSVGRGHSKKTKFSMHNNSQKPSSSKAPNGGAGCGAAAGSSSSTKDPPPLSAADRMEHQTRKVKLLSMLDEVDGRYNDYCEQMQTVLNSFDYVMGFGAALRYTALAQKAMSWHFRCLRRGIEAQLKHSCELLGEKDEAGASRLTKGETPRLKLLDQRFRQQRAFREMGMMDQKATWRPQRGLPERSVNVLRSWLFDHFPSPSAIGFLRRGAYVALTAPSPIIRISR
ncbi:hypothetical protein Nepgr_016586 [Nepenthes gracilis]|uniref:POX domain-containing protein n=1 Tax=Nepenthes gracilis TaxID=150966 RepID=A0AAD3XSM5_NEPGR|nr:hypothetical protein Nepgr_016586 [Nepenthes gracilis]